MKRTLRAALVLGGLLPALFSLNAAAGQAHKAGGHQAKQHSGAGGKTPIRTTMEELHRHGGTPSGWRFQVPEGDPGEGKRVHVKLECFACHNVRGEKFPRRDPKPTDEGPDLTGMGVHHPAAYFFESILHPNRVIVEGPGYIGPDGLSIMPSYNHLLTVDDAVNLAAHIRGFKGSGGKESGEHASHMQGKPMTKEAKPHHSGKMAQAPKGTIHLQIKNQKIAGAPRTIRVTQGDMVHLRFTSDEATDLHLHGYDIEKSAKPGAPAVFSFKATAAGRFPITFHGAKGHGHGGENSKRKGPRETTLIFLEVHPR